ncbi:unnamed protein product [Cladocopium goreaui]|uniref:Probable carbohydrate esterase At4g34215 n=1 Tax=Cladocopium goreaui TaxID=2562237 RepID=A0A9P1CMP5_9DINO|nr:unnamed protein product [Cladocopium goreaui]
MDQTSVSPIAMFLLAGQSNMSGRGEIVGDSVYDSRILKIAGGTWSVARHPLHADKPEKAGVGPGMSFARSIVDFVPAPVGLVPCAFGGSEIQRWIAGGDLLQAAKETVAQGQAAGGVLKGILWHQGESDCGSEEMASLYIDRLQQLSEDLRSAFGHVPLILGELGMEFLDLEDPRFSFAETVNASIVKFGSSGEHIGVVSARGLQHKGDRLHFSSTAADELGKRYAWKWLEMTGGLNLSLRTIVGSSLSPPFILTSLGSHHPEAGEPKDASVLDQDGARYQQSP